MAFFAIQPPIAIRQKLAQSLSYYQQQFSGVDWENFLDLHITLKFFTGWNRNESLQLASSLNDDIASLLPSSLEISLSGHKCFLKRGRARVLWLEVDGGPALEDLAAKLDHILAEKFAIPREARPLRPHLTLGRVQEAAAFPLADWYALPKFDIIFQAEQVQLMKRRSGNMRTAEGALYETLASMKLPGSWR